MTLTTISSIIAAISMTFCFIVMVKLETKSKTLKIAYFLLAFVSLIGLAQNINADWIMFLWALTFIAMSLGWYRFYKKHKYFFDFAKYESGAAMVIYDVDEKGTIKWLNKEAAKMLGYEREDLIGRASDYIVPDSEAKDFIIARQDAYYDLHHFGLAQVIFTYRKKDGNSVKIKTIVYPVKIGNKVVEYLGVSLRA